MMNQSSLRDLRDAAERATPGPWAASFDNTIGTVEQVETGKGVAYDILFEPDAAYISLASPDVVLRLLKVVDAAHMFYVWRPAEEELHDSKSEWWLRREALAAALSALNDLGPIQP